MTPGPTSSPEHDAELLFQSLGKNRTCVDHYITQATGISFISGGGSDRRFFRFKLSNRPVVLMVSPPHDQEFDNYCAIARFLRSLGAAVPEIYDVYRDEHIVVMEDLGDTSLYSVLKNEERNETIIAWYRRVLDLLACMQVEGRSHWGSCPQATERTFDYAALRWETDYFRNSFVEQYCTIDLSVHTGLDWEFHRLAEIVSKEPVFLMHRDFQSQNLMVHEGALRVIDFQGARKGLLQYDLASALKDSYIVLPNHIQQQLVLYYIQNLRDRGVAVSAADRFFDLYTLAGLQRNMQALGAFAFLSREKGKTWFKQYIPAGLHHLKTALAERKDFPVLRKLIKRIKEKLSL